MPENNQIQEISELIASLFSKSFKPEFEKFLADKNIPFANQTDLYVQRLFNSVLSIPNIEVISYDFNGPDIIVKLSGPFKSYANINGKDVNFNNNGIAIVTLKNGKVTLQDGVFLNLLIQSTFSEEKNIENKTFDLSYEQEDRLYKFLISKKIYNDDLSNILKAEFLNNKIIIKNTAPFDIYINNHKIEKKSTIEVPLTIKNLLTSSNTYFGYIRDWSNKTLANNSYLFPSNFASSIGQKFIESFDQTKDYSQDGLYFDKDSVLKNYNSAKINFKKPIEFKNGNPIKYYKVNIDRNQITTGQVTTEDLKDIAAYQCPSALETYLYDSTGKKKYIENSGMGNGFMIFDLGE